MTSVALIERFLVILMRESGGTRRRWRGVLGEVRLYSTATHLHCNWSLTPTGTADEIAAVERIADRLRGEHPIVSD